jgi:CRISPR-associated protein Cas2
VLYLVAYDVVDDNRRRRIMEALKDYGRRVQYSVFELDTDAKGLAGLCERLSTEMELAEDSCRLYRICAGCSSEVVVLGPGDRYSEPGFVVV